MENSIVEQVFGLISQALWPVLSLGMCLAGILLFRAEQRHYLIVLAIGAFVLFGTAATQFLLFNPIFGLVTRGEMEPASIGSVMIVVNAVGLLAQGMVVYGLLSHAFVRLKVSRLDGGEG